MSIKNTHSVFVLDKDGNPLTPTTSAKGRKLLEGGVAKKVWSKFNTFGIQMLIETRNKKPFTTLGYDVGTKYEGFAVVCGNENVLAVQLHLPDKKNIVRKIKERSILRNVRRQRNCRRRPVRFSNRKRSSGWIAPSQLVIFRSRLKILKALFAIYPIHRVGLEDVKFNHKRNKWGSNFSTMEIGKNVLRNWIDKHAERTEYQGWETQLLRKEYGYKKTANKSANKFTTHCSDALALACAVGGKERGISYGRFIVVDDTYRPIRRKLHDTQPAKGGIRAFHSSGNVFGLRKGLLIGAKNGNVGQLCGSDSSGIRYYGLDGKRKRTVLLHWISSNFIIK